MMFKPFIQPLFFKRVKENNIRILGIDPGLRVTGYGLIDSDGGVKQLSYVASGVIKPPVDGALFERLGGLARGIEEVIQAYEPEVVAIEVVFVNVNPQSTLLLGQARGALIASAVLQGKPVNEYTALQIKQAVVGQGHATKDQVRAMVKHLLCLIQPPGSDASDALACAIRHAHGLGGPIYKTRPSYLVRGGRWVRA